MRRSSLLIAMLSISFMTTACGGKAYNPFMIGKDDFFGKTKTIALAPIKLGIDVEGDDAAEEFNSKKEEFKREIYLLITNALTEAGFSVIPPEKYGEIWEEKVSQQGGIFDPVTGKQDDSKRKEIEKETVQELLSEFPAEGVLYPELVLVRAKFSTGIARWDGTSQKINGSLEILGGASGVITAMFSQGVLGDVPALSLFIRISDPNTGEDIFRNRGGVQILSRKASRFGSFKFEPVPASDLFASKERNQAAVAYALNPLVRDPAQAK